MRENLQSDPPPRGARENSHRRETPQVRHLRVWQSLQQQFHSQQSLQDPLGGETLQM
ncbi:hypothetical protein LEMLEM_LOCUS19484 [Lemmus lemmus]